MPNESMEVPYIDTRPWDGTILDVLYKNVAKVRGVRAKASGYQISGLRVRKDETLREITRHGHI